MIKVLTTVVSLLNSNSHIVYDDENKNCLIIDLGGHFSQISDKIEALGLTVKGLLLTHGHFDHSQGAFELEKLNVPVYISQKDSYMLKSADDCFATKFGASFSPVNKCNFLSEGEYGIGGFKIKVIETPGHTAGSLCFMIGDKLFTGDTLFKDGYGRYDLPTGNFAELVNSFKKLKKLSNLTVYCGHGDNTTIDYEKGNNPLFRYEN